MKLYTNSEIILIINIRVGEGPSRFPICRPPLLLISPIWVVVNYRMHSFKTWFGLTGQFETWLVQNWNRVELKKNRGWKNPVWPGNPVDPARPIKNPIVTRWLFFLLKRYSFDFLKKINPNNLIKTRNLSLGLDQV
jgi:hypothetical protein